MTESHPDPRPKGIRAWAHVKHPGVRLFRRIMDGGSHYPSGFTSLGRNIEIGAGIASVFATDEEWRSLNALIDEAEARSSHSDAERLAAGVQAALTIRLIAGNTDQTYTPNEVATMVAEIVGQQMERLDDG